MNGIKNTTARRSALLTLSIASLMVVTMGQKIQVQRRDDFCSQTARALFEACKAEVIDNSFKKKAICINISDPQKRRECLDELEAAEEEGNALCKEQRDGRLDACGSLGEARFDPTIDPARFDTDFRNLTNPNPYFPL